MKPNKVEIVCVCKRKHVIKIGATKEHPCRCGSGVVAKYDGDFVTPWSMHAPDRFTGCKPVITKWYWPNGHKLSQRLETA